MAITSFTFIGFIVVVAGVYYALNRRAQNAWLLLVSYAFYLTWAWQFALVLLAMTLANYLLGHAIHRARHRRPWLLIGIAMNLGMLALFKYADYFVPRILSIPYRLGFPVSAIEVLLPVGLSFLVLQAISYLVDVSRGRLEATHSWVDFALYLAYFPKLLSGPIERASDFLSALSAPRVVDNDRLARGLALIALGMFRKLILATALNNAMPGNPFRSPSAAGTLSMATWLLAYGCYLYNDFAGYSEIARGVSSLFGIDLAVNFRQPYLARNFTEFWNSWHISLSAWLRDYIYLPVSRALLRRSAGRRNLLNLAVPPVVTMLVSAAWHGISWNMLVWGALHGLYQVVQQVPALWRPVVPPQKWPRWRQHLARLAVIVLASLAWVPFQVDLADTLTYWRGLLQVGVVTLPSPALWLWIGVSFGVDALQVHSKDDLVMLRWPRWVQAGMLTILIYAAIVVSTLSAVKPFVYQGF